MSSNENVLIGVSPTPLTRRPRKRGQRQARTGLQGEGRVTTGTGGDKPGTKERGHPRPPTRSWAGRGLRLSLRSRESFCPHTASRAGREHPAGISSPPAFGTWSQRPQGANSQFYSQLCDMIETPLNKKAALSVTFLVMRGILGVGRSCKVPAGVYPVETWTATFLPVHLFIHSFIHLSIQSTSRTY